MQVEMLPPYIAPEHQLLIDEAEKMLKDYSEWLIAKLTPKGTDCIAPLPSDYEKAQKLFLEDPVRLMLVRRLAEMKALFEIPRFLVKP